MSALNGTHALCQGEMAVNFFDWIELVTCSGPHACGSLEQKSVLLEASTVTCAELIL
jgi:hypothetical protein